VEAERRYLTAPIFPPASSSSHPITPLLPSKRLFSLTQSVPLAGKSDHAVSLAGKSDLASPSSPLPAVSLGASRGDSSGQAFIEAQDTKLGKRLVEVGCRMGIHAVVQLVLIGQHVSGSGYFTSTAVKYWFPVLNTVLKF
jgi:hypothetical protein